MLYVRTHSLILRLASSCAAAAAGVVRYHRTFTPGTNIKRRRAERREPVLTAAALIVFSMADSFTRLLLLSLLLRGEGEERGGERNEEKRQ